MQKSPAEMQEAVDAEIAAVLKEIDALGKLILEPILANHRTDHALCMEIIKAVREQKPFQREEVDNPIGVFIMGALGDALERHPERRGDILQALMEETPVAKTYPTGVSLSTTMHPMRRRSVDDIGSLGVISPMSSAPVKKPTHPAPERLQ
jgi:hypothetical protein